MGRPLDEVDLSRVTSGDPDAWEHFVPAAASLARAVIRRLLARHRLGDHTDDVVQEVFVRLCRNDFRLLKSYDSARASLSTWLGVIASAAAIDFLRAQARHAAEPLDTSIGRAATLDSMPGSDRLELPPDLLTPRQRIILRLSYEQDLDVPEIARLLNIQAQTVRSMRHKAIERLRAWYGASRGGDDLVTRDE